VRTIELSREPSYWDRLGVLPMAIRHLMAHHDPAPYVGYWIARTGQSVELAKQHAAYVAAMAEDITTNGYDVDRWKTDVRGLEFARDGFGPITVTKAGAVIWPRDGSHRACILRVCERPIPALLWKET
jgi:hypothetical protein